MNSIKSYLLSKSSMYKLSQQLLNKGNLYKYYVSNYISSNVKILDIGCGTADILDYLPYEVSYTGIDHNQKYIDFARNRYKNLGKFFKVDVNDNMEDIVLENNFDIVMANGVLHHLDDREANKLLEFAKSKLKNSGVFISFDGCYLSEQNFISRLLLQNDRGEFVRYENEYIDLIKHHFDKISVELKEDLLRVPYTLIFIRATK